MFFLTCLNLPFNSISRNHFPTIVSKAMFQVLLPVESEDIGHRPLSQISANIYGLAGHEECTSPSQVFSVISTGKTKHHLKIVNCVLFCRRAEDSNPGRSLSSNSEGLLHREETRYIGGFATKTRWLKHQKITDN